MEQEAVAPTEKVLATANGVGITEFDFQWGLAKRKARADELTDERKRIFVETLVREELAAQEAVRLGLDRDPAYQTKIREAEAQLRALRRDGLAQLFQNHVRTDLGPTEADARAYYERYGDRIRSSVHVLQIAYRDRTPDKLSQDEKDLKAGVPFLEVAKRRYPEPPKDVRPPWDLGYLHWNLVPKAWRDVLDTMKPGDTSRVIRGEQGRVWLVHLVDRRTDPSVTWESERQRIIEVLRAEDSGTRYEDAIRALRKSANVTLSE